jgi:Right handed beta helix region
MNLVGSYVVIEGFDLNNANADRQRAQISLRGGSHHVAIRNNEIHEQIPDPGGCAICVGGAQDVVIYSNHIHHNAWDPRSSVEHDIHGVQVPAGSQRVWIVDNEFDHNGGDAVQVNSGRNILASHIYIARNNMHEDTENCIDIKQAEDVIISQNTCWGYVPTAFGTSGSDGTAIVINDDNIANGLNNRVWVIFNRVHSSVNGIRTQAYAYVIGNVLHDLAGAGLVSFGSHDVWFEHNTIYNAQGGGIDRSGGATTFKVEARNNIFHPGAGRDAVSLTSNASGNSVLHNSLFTAPIRWSGVLYGSLASFQSAVPGRCSGCRAGDPLFVNPAASDFRLQAGSPAIDGAAPSSLYDLFESL